MSPHHDEIPVGRHVVGDEDSDPMVARMGDLDGNGNVELEVLPGPIESHADLLTLA